MYLKRVTSYNYLNAVLVVLLLAGMSSMSMATWHVHECTDHECSEEQDCMTCTFQKSTSGFIITSPETAIVAQYPTFKNSDLTIEAVADDALIFATSSRAPPLFLL